MDAIDKEMERLRNTQYNRDDDDDREETIEKLKEVNEMLVEKVRELESIVGQTVGKSRTSLLLYSLNHW